MKLIYDRLAKEVLVHCLRPVSRELTPEREVAADAQRLDLWCVPDEGRLDALAPLGLLHAVVSEGPCAFEFFHEAPSPAEMRGSLVKALLLRRPAALPTQGKEPWLWIIAGGRPERAFSAFGLSPEPGWPRGIYGTTPGLRTRLVVTSELPRAPETLIFRALGAGRTLREALLELRELGLDHSVSRIIVPIMLNLRIEQRARSGKVLDPFDQEFQMETQEIYEAWYQQVRAEGEALGRAEGEALGRAEGEALGRAEGEALGEARALLRVLQARGLELSPEQLGKVRQCRDLETLETWLGRAATAASCDEVFS